MHNKALYIHTHDLDYDCIKIANTNLPGQYANGFSPIDPMAISAHENTETVVNFMRTVLNIKYIDSKQKLEFISTVKCLKRTNTTKEWRNACWLPGQKLNQVVYGQELIDGQLKSYGEKLEIVAHEFFHGIIQYTAKLNSRGESGALNESYADIFAVLINNYTQKDFGKWNWEIGRPFGETNQAIRNIANPALHGHPTHMDDYLNINNNHQKIHTNCSIHNKAAYNLIVSKSNQTKLYIFDVPKIANLFYLTLKTRLTSNSSFFDSRIGLLTTAPSLYIGQPNKLVEVTEAIEKAFSSVGILDE